MSDEERDDILRFSRVVAEIETYDGHHLELNLLNTLTGVESRDHEVILIEAGRKQLIVDALQFYVCCVPVIERMSNALHAADEYIGLLCATHREADWAERCAEATKKYEEALSAAAMDIEP
jgi:hypothetical protein